MQIQTLKNRVRLFRTHLSFSQVPEERISEDPVLELEKNEIFVFGSNLLGRHGGGAAYYAEKHFGALNGVAVGHAGKSYAVPTLSSQYEKLSLEYIESHVEDLIEHAFLRPHKTYVVSAIGCGIAGFTPEEIAPMFKNAIGLSNVKLPQDFWDILLER